MKWSRKHFAEPVSRLRFYIVAGAITFSAASCIVLSAHGELPKWMQFAVSGSEVEAALYRAMDLAGVKVLYPKPPSESRTALSDLVRKSPQQADLYSLRARADEQALDFAAAEADWKAYAAHASDPVGAKLELADFFERRMRWHDEIAVLMDVAAAPSSTQGSSADLGGQRSWQAFQRILATAKDAELSQEETAAVYQARIRRFPGNATAYSDAFTFLLDAKRFDDAGKVLAAYKQAFPDDAVFPVKAEALLEYRSGSLDHALSAYDRAFEPLWPQELIDSYLELLAETHNERAFLQAARQHLAQNPDDLNAAARIYFFYRRQGRTDAAQQELTGYRLSKEQRHATWTAEELDTLAQLFDQEQNYPEAARYYYALYGAKGTVRGANPQETALSGVIGILFSAPDQPLQLGAGNLAMYRDIATMDTGPGYLNGILSLFFNSANPESESHDEEQRAQSYFHRSKATQLLAVLDAKFPNAPARPGLHAEMVSMYANYGLSDAVIREGLQYLASFPQGADRFHVAMAVADAYARKNRSKEEFEVYDRMLVELSAAAKGMPLTDASASEPEASQPDTAERANDDQETPATPTTAGPAKSRALQAAPGDSAQPASSPRAGEYSQVLERYLSRLTAGKQLPQALQVLRRELDRNPNDPGIYERLAEFLAQNRFDEQQEEVYRRAMEKFSDKSWYDKLARLYLREKKQQEFRALTRQVVETFQGTELERYFAQVHENSPQLFLEVNLYANQRFPHDMVFVRNLLRAYGMKGIADSSKREALLREHWFESPELQAQFFHLLSRTGKLQTEMAQLEQSLAAPAAGSKNYAAMHELAEADIWYSHFEQGAPLLGELASAYPAHQEIGDEASEVFRSLAYFDPSRTAQAVMVEKNLLLAAPGNMDRLARIGDIYADRGHMEEAAQYWRQMPLARPGSPDGYLQAATVFWDYFRFDDALAEIQAARTKFHQPTLYGYEAGAIEENKGDSAAAVHEYTLAALADKASPAAAERLLVLSRRPATREAADAATAQAEAAENAPPAALDLRVDLLTAQDRTSELPGLLSQIIAKTSSADVLAHVKQIAGAHSFSAVSEAAIQREITLASDPVHRMELQLELAHAYEDRKAPAQAEATLQRLYRENPKILGVIRAAVDFDWRNGQRPRAIATLLQAAKDAAPNLAPQFSLEAADKASQSGEYAQAREILSPLLTGSPFHPQYIAAMADTYARANDDAGLRDFYLGKIEAIQSAPMSRDERKEQRAALRRNLVPALTRLKDYNGATEQYMAILSAYPEDASLLQEIVSYARRYHREQQLIAFGTKAVSDSPQDSRFAVILARVESAFQDYPAAIAAYSKAIALRKDRSDLYVERVNLEERLQRFDDVCADYERLYVLSYKDPQWIVSEAKVRVRQGKTDLAVQALKMVWVDGHAERASDQFQVAKQLEEWGLIDSARQFVEQGVKLAGNDLLQPENAFGATLYARIETRLHREQEAYQTLLSAQTSAGQLSPGLIIEQVEKQGIAAVTDAQWRTREVAARKEAAETNFRRILMEMGRSVSTYFTPEEKLAFGQFVGEKKQGLPRSQIADTWIPVVHEAGLLDVEEQWRHELIGGGGEIAEQQIQPFSELEKQRLRYNELGQVLEHYASTLSKSKQDQMLLQAAEVYWTGGNQTAAFALMKGIGIESPAMQGWRERYFQILLAHSPDALVPLAGQASDETADAAANFLLANSDEAHVRSAISARTRPAVWKSATTALAGLYYADKADAVNTAFLQTLGDATIGQRLAHQADATQQIAGKSWFYYGMRYGVYLTFSGHGNEEDYIVANLERDTGNIESYLALAGAYADAGENAKALAEYRDALQLEPDTASIYDAMAVVQWSDGKHNEAIESWKTALGLLGKQVDMSVVPESFWTSFTSVAGHLGERKLAASLKPEMDAVVRAYIAKNGSYQCGSLLRAAFDSLGDPQQAVKWVIDLVMAAKDPSELFPQIRNADWIPLAQQQGILENEVQFARRSKSTGVSQDGVTPDQKAEQLATAQIRLLKYLLRTRQYPHATEVLESIAPSMRITNRGELLPYEIRMAAHTGALAAWLDTYQKEFDSRNDQAGGQYGESDELKTLSSTAQALFEEGQAASASSLLQFVLQKKQESGTASPPDYLALAEAEIAAGNMPGALEQLRRLLLIDDFYANLESSASLLERTGHSAEALEFLEPLASGVPWEPTYKLRLAQAQLKANAKMQPALEVLTQLASNNYASYDVRVQAASALRGAKNVVNLGSAELMLLSSGGGGGIAAPLADKPYFLPARVVAARTAPAPERLLLDALAYGAGDDARLMLFHAEFKVGHDALALAAIQPLLSGQSDSTGTPRWAQSDNDSNSSSSEDNQEPASNTGLLPRVPPGEKSKVAEELAAIYERTGEFASAISWLNSAGVLAADSSHAQGLREHAAVLQAKLSREVQNATRRPVIQESLDQTIVVRPRIASAANHAIGVQP